MASTIIEGQALPTQEPLQCQGCEARHDGVCHALTVEQLTRLAKMTSKRVVPNGEAIGRGILGGEGMANMLGGAVRLTRHLPDGRRQIVGLQFAPTLLGRVHGTDDDVETVAAGTVRLCSFPRSAFEATLAQSHDLQDRVLDQTMAQLDEARDWLVSVGRKTALERVATYLELVARHAGRAVAGAGSGILDVPLPLTRGEMADLLGLTIETVSRKMTELRRMGIVDFADASHVRVLSPDRLHAATGS